MKIFKITDLLTSGIRTATVGFNWGWALTGGKIVWDLFSGYKKSEDYKQAGESAKWASYQNAGDLINMGHINAEAMMAAAHNTAGSILRIGEYNASAVERATERNLKLYGMQADEEVRRHVYAEKYTAGSIRAMAGAGGVQTNTGTPLHYLNSQIDEGLRQRVFLQDKHKQTMWTMEQEGKDKAWIYRVTAQENANVILSNAELQAGVALSEAQMRAAAMQRSGDQAFYQAEASASSALWGGLGNAVMTGISGFSNFGNPFSGWGNKSSFNVQPMNNWWSNQGFGSGMQAGFAGMQGWGQSSSWGLNAQPTKWSFEGWD